MIYVLSGGGSAFAVIDVTYPAGATCTCSNGTRTLKAKDTSGHFLFVIPKAGKWTVKAVKGDDSDSEIINVAEEKAYTAKLTFELILFDNGVVSGTTWSGFYVSNVLRLSHSNSSGYIDSNTGSSNESVDLSGYSVLYITVKSLQLTGYSGFDFGVGPKSGADLSAKVNVSSGISEETTKSVDISKVSSGYIKGILSARSGTSTVEITKIWLE